MVIPSYQNPVLDWCANVHGPRPTPRVVVVVAVLVEINRKHQQQQQLVREPTWPRRTRKIGPRTTCRNRLSKILTGSTRTTTTTTTTKIRPELVRNQQNGEGGRFRSVYPSRRKKSANLPLNSSTMIKATT